MKLKYRCGSAGCRKIHTLSKHPSEYHTEKKCGCGGTLHDYSMDRKRNKVRTCKCDGESFPHKKGSSVWCQHHATGPTEEDQRERYG